MVIQILGTRVHCLSIIYLFHSVDIHNPSQTSRSVSSVLWITPGIRRMIHRKNQTGQRSAVSHKFDPGPVPYFAEIDHEYGHSPPFP